MLELIEYRSEIGHGGELYQRPRVSAYQMTCLGAFLFRMRYEPVLLSWLRMFTLME
jgi:hypothetical protein